MPLSFERLGSVLRHIYDFDLGGTIYLPPVGRYEADTPCIVATQDEDGLLHQSCLEKGFNNWLNVAVVSDTCDAVTEQTEPNLMVAFNDDCREGGWLREMMNHKGGWTSK